MKKLASLMLAGALLGACSSSEPSATASETPTPTTTPTTAPTSEPATTLAPLSVTPETTATTAPLPEIEILATVPADADLDTAFVIASEGASRRLVFEEFQQIMEPDRDPFESDLSYDLFQQVDPAEDGIEIVTTVERADLTTRQNAVDQLDPLIGIQVRRPVSADGEIGRGVASLVAETTTLSADQSAIAAGFLITLDDLASLAPPAALILDPGVSWQVTSNYTTTGGLPTTAVTTLTVVSVSDTGIEVALVRETTFASIDIDLNGEIVHINDSSYATSSGIIWWRDGFPLPLAMIDTATDLAITTEASAEVQHTLINQNQEISLR